MVIKASGRFVLLPAHRNPSPSSDLYVAEVCWTSWPGLFPDEPRPDNLRTIQKYQRVH